MSIKSDSISSKSVNSFSSSPRTTIILESPGINSPSLIISLKFPVICSPGSYLALISKDASPVKPNSDGNIKNKSMRAPNIESKR